MKRFSRIIAGILGFIFFGLLLWMMVDVKQDIIDNATTIKKKVEVRNVRYVGFKDRKRIFSVRALSGWSGADVDESYLSDVVDGQIYNMSDHVIIEQIKAKKVYSNARYDSIFAENGLSAVFIPAVNADEKSVPEKVQIEAEQLRYDSLHKKTYIEGNIKLTQGKTDIFADKAEIDNDTNVANFLGNVSLVGEEVTITANTLIAYFDEERNVATGGVTLFWYAKPGSATDNSRQSEFRSQETTITCHDMDYRKIKDEEYLTFNENVVITQKNKRLKGDYALYSGKEKKFYLSDNIYIELTSLEWLMKKDTKKKLSSKDAQEAVKQRTTATGEELVFNRMTNDFILRGDVHIDQPKNEAFAQEVSYDDKKEQLTLINYVRIKKKGKDWIDCQEARMFLKDELFEAMNKVLTEFTIKKKK